MKCRNCKHLDKGWCAHKIDSPDPELERECKDYMQATNADRIRAMSDEEMATDLILMFEELFEDGIPGTDYMRFWLQQPAEEDT